MRWGRFIEQVLSCKIGVPIKSSNEAIDYIDAFGVAARKAYKQVQNLEKQDLDLTYQDHDMTYFVAVKNED